MFVRCLKIKWVLWVLICLPVMVCAEPVYQCEDTGGNLMYQGLPCEGETIQVITDAEKKHKAMFTQAMVQALAKLTKKKTKEYNDSKKLKAMEVLAMTDAAKSYAFTQVYLVSAKYCGKEVASELLNYQNQASEVIALGAYYYSQGIDANIDGKDFSQSGQKLTAALYEMTENLAEEHQHASAEQLARKCKEAKSALNTLAFLYSN